MGPRARIVLIAAGVGILAASAAALWIFDASRHPASSGFLIHAHLPAGHNIAGEAVVGGALQKLIVTQGNETTYLDMDGPVDALTLRLRSEQDRYYDIGIARTITLSGFDPRTSATLSTGERAIYTGIPMDWNGRIVLDAPRAAFTLSTRDVRLDITRPIGGAS